jgi:Fic family protein
LVRALRPKLRAMNSYYSNKIEDQHTKPAAIERALHQQFDANLAMARKQRVAVAHMEVEEQLEQGQSGRPAKDLFDPALVREIHKRLYGKLPEADRMTEEGKRIVQAGQHVAPPRKDVEGLMEAWAGRYRALAGTEALLIGAACSHHRLAWFHPFIDGNGRTARLHTHLVLDAMGLTQGLWSPMRGLARTQDLYFARLHNADMSRPGALYERAA